ncbi:MAG: hypothetical protein WCL23_03470 [Candidatus Moraniibacteriota bacterium]
MNAKLSVQRNGETYSRLKQHAGEQFFGKTLGVCAHLEAASTEPSRAASALLNECIDIVDEIGLKRYLGFLSILDTCAGKNILANDVVYYGRFVYAISGKSVLMKMIKARPESMKESAFPLAYLSQSGTSRKCVRRCLVILKQSGVDAARFFLECYELFRSDSSQKFKMADLAILRISRMRQLNAGRSLALIRGAKAYMGKNVTA